MNSETTTISNSTECSGDSVQREIPIQNYKLPRGYSKHLAHPPKLLRTAKECSTANEHKYIHTYIHTVRTYKGKCSKRFTYIFCVERNRPSKHITQFPAINSKNSKNCKITQCMYIRMHVCDSQIHINVNKRMNSMYGILYMLSLSLFLFGVVKVNFETLFVRSW